MEYKNKYFAGERIIYGLTDAILDGITFGSGESPLKEAKQKTALEQHLERLSMEMRGIEPLSKRISSLTSTIIVILLELH